MPAAVNRIASWLDMPANIVLVGLLVAGGLAVGSIIRCIQLRGADPADRRRHLGSLSVWWVLLALVALIAWGGATAGALVCGVASFIGLREYFALLDRKGLPGTGRTIVYLGVPITYGIAACSDQEGYLAFVAAAVVISISILLVTAGVTVGFLATAASLVWGYVIMVCFLSYAVLLVRLPEATNANAGGGAGWLVWLVLFTESDDIFQALWGRRFGRHRITPLVSPGKTWEGFLLGGITALAISTPLAPLLTPLASARTFHIAGQSFWLPGAEALAAGVLLWLVGFFGDLNLSALKRDAGVKDTGTWIPGQGGILDRMDSLLFTAPVCYFLARCFHD